MTCVSESTALTHFVSISGMIVPEPETLPSLGSNKITPDQENASLVMDESGGRLVDEGGVANEDEEASRCRAPGSPCQVVPQSEPTMMEALCNFGECDLIDGDDNH